MLAILNLIYYIWFMMKKIFGGALLRFSRPNEDQFPQGNELMKLATLSYQIVKKLKLGFRAIHVSGRNLKKRLVNALLDNRENTFLVQALEISASDL